MVETPERKQPVGESKRQALVKCIRGSLRWLSNPDNREDLVYNKTLVPATALTLVGVYGGLITQNPAFYITFGVGVGLGTTPYAYALGSEVWNLMTD